MELWDSVSLHKTLERKQADFFYCAWPLGLLKLPSTCEHPYCDRYVKYGECLTWCLCVLSVLSVSFPSTLRETEVLKYQLKTRLSKPPTSPLSDCFFIPRNVCRAVSGYFTNRKDDTRTYCNYVQRYRFSPVFTCKLEQSVLESKRILFVVVMCYWKSLLCPSLWPLVEGVGSDLGRAAG